MGTPNVEEVKAHSAHLRSDLRQQLASDAAGFSADAGQVLKFHGIYQQDDRDRRRELARSERGLAYSCMVRCSVPGGVLRRDQWFEIDRLADDVADGRLRLTTRQGVQYHFVHKGDLRRLVASLNRGLVTTYAACGDVVRNVMVTSAPVAGRDLARLDSLARALSNRFRPRSPAYWELWLDGERAVTAGPDAGPDADSDADSDAGPDADPHDVSRRRADRAGRPGRGGPAADAVEPIYGATYLPRKFKVAVAWPGDNSVDVYSNDVGLVLVPGPSGERGAVVLVGGGLGRSHTDATTFPRLAEPLAWVPDESIADVVEAIVVLFREEGNRQDRSHARLKYLVEERGVGWVRRRVEQALGRRLADPRPIPAWGGARDHLGWHRQDDGRWFLGLPVPTGRLADDPFVARRSAVRAILERYADEIRLTPHQDLLLCNIDGADRAAVEAILETHGVPLARHLPLTVLSSMACPALPTCGQALGEAERVLPAVTDLLDHLLGERGLGDVRIETRLTGCPNGCARPYVAELGIVARSKRAYDLFVGGDPAGTRLARPLIESVPFDELADVLAPLLDRFGSTRHAEEAFGDWADRVGVDALRAELPDVGRRAPVAVGGSA